jgi:uncharacterized protein YdaU (DUF1376 family)
VNYYPFHIGDYAAHTGHLDPILSAQEGRICLTAPDQPKAAR